MARRPRSCPSSALPNRVPSSSENPTTSSANGSGDVPQPVRDGDREDDAERCRRTGRRRARCRGATRAGRSPGCPAAGACRRRRGRPRVARGVGLGVEAGVAHPGPDRHVGGGVLGRQVDPLDAVRSRRVARQVVAPRHHPLGALDGLTVAAPAQRRERGCVRSQRPPGHNPVLARTRRRERGRRRRPPDAAPARRSTCSSAASVVSTASRRAL